MYTTNSNHLTTSPNSCMKRSAVLVIFEHNSPAQKQKSVGEFTRSNRGASESLFLFAVAHPSYVFQLAARDVRTERCRLRRVRFLVAMAESF